MTTVDRDCDVSRHAVGRIALFFSPDKFVAQELSELSKYRESHEYMLLRKNLICFGISFC